MRLLSRFLLSTLALGLLVTLPAGLRAHAGPPASPAGTALADLAAAFGTPPDAARPMMRWWWFGPTVTKSGLARELRAMKDGGIGGVEIQPVYPVVLDDPRRGLQTHAFLSDPFLDHLRYAARTARELGLRVDLTLGSGWPYGGPPIGISDAAGKLRVERVAIPPEHTRVAVPDIRSGEHLIAAFLVPHTTPIDMAAVETVSVGTAGAVDVQPAPVARELVFFVSSRTGMMVKRAAVGAEGFVLDHYSRDALDTYLSTVGTRLLSAFDGQPPDAIFCDSLEVFDSDWTPSFLDEFRRRRGYDLRPLLPALVLDAGPATAALRHDWGLTLTELVTERFLTPMQAWARARGTRFRLQGYGVPPATISSNADVDLPEGEGHQWKTVRASRWAASIAHLYDRPVVSSETWTWLHSPVFRASPLDLKVEADLHLLQGINQFIGHGWPYTAEGAAYPGWRFYAAGVFNDRNPWWTVMPDLTRYLQRLSYLMRQGHPVIDVALYLPIADTYAAFTPNKLGSLIEQMNQRMGPGALTSILEAGFNVDFVDDGVLTGATRVEDGHLVIGRNRYAAIVLPAVERMAPTTLRGLDRLARQGVRIFATGRLPGLVPGYLATAEDHAALSTIAAGLFRQDAAPGIFVAHDADLGAALAARITPDATVSEGADAIGIVHRRTDAGDVYFVANTSNVSRTVTATFRVRAGRAERWDPVAGTTRAWPIAPGRQPGRTAVTLDLAPYESTVLVFPADLSVPPAGVVRPSGTMPSPVDISGDWQVTIGQRATESWPRLKSWTEDETTRFYSGTAVYERDIDLPGAMAKPGLAVRLDFGEGRPVPDGGPRARFQAWLDAPVREAAIVFVNGQRVGSVWAPPYAIDITRAVRPGKNRLRLDVANLAINHLAGHALPDYRLLNLRYGSRFDPQDMDKVAPVPAGVLGPIRLVAVPEPAGHLPRGR